MLRDEDTQPGTPHRPNELIPLGGGKVIVGYSPRDGLTRDIRDQQHDATAALRTIDAVVKALKAGYRFQDASADTKIQCLNEALATLGEDVALLGQIRAAVTSQP